MFDGDCGIYNVGTLEHARRRGLGTALTALLVYEALVRGCETASLQSTKMAKHLSAAVGFRNLGRILGVLRRTVSAILAAESAAGSTRDGLGQKLAATRGRLSDPRKPSSALLPWLAGSLLSISNAVRPRVAGCLGNGSVLARGGSLMERLWIREVRRAVRRASAPFAWQIALGCGAAAVGTMVASLLPLRLDGRGAGRMGRCVGSSWIRRHLGRACHLSPVEVSI